MTSEKKKIWERRLLKIAAGVALIILLGVAAIWTAAHELAPEKLKALLQTTISDFLGRRLTIEEISLAPFPKMELRARGVRLVDKQGRTIVDCPSVTAAASLLAVLKLHIGIEEILFEKPEIHLWYERDGRLNVERISDEIAARPAAPTSSSPQTIFLHRFRIADGRLQLADVAGAPPVIDGRVNGQLTLRFSPMGLRGIPFELDVDEGEKGTHIEASGRFGKHPKVEVRGERVPAQAFSPRLAGIGNCAGAADLRLNWKGGPDSALEFGISPAGLCHDKGALPQRLSGNVKKRGDEWKLEFSASGKDTALNAKGTIPPQPKPMTFEVTGASASVEAVSAWGSAFNAIAGHAGPVVAPSTAPARVFAVKVAVASATWQGFQLSRVNFDVNRGTDSVVWVRPINLDVFGGDIQGQVRIRDNLVAVDLHGHTLSLADLAAAFGSSGALRGQMSVTLTGEVPIGAPVVSSFTGHTEVWVDNFELDRVPAILKIVTSGSFVKLEQRIKGDKDRNKFQPSKGNGQAELKDGVAEVRKLWLENRVLRLGFQGKVKYAAKEIDGSMVVQALTAADQLINNLPLVRDIVLNGGKSLIPLWFRVEGPWADPKTRPMPLKSIEAPFLRIFKGLIDLPQDLYDKVRGKE